MDCNQESYPEKIRRIAEDMSQMRKLYEVDHAVDILRKIADELEALLNQATFKEA